MRKTYKVITYILRYYADYLNEGEKWVIEDKCVESFEDYSEALSYAHGFMDGIDYEWQEDEDLTWKEAKENNIILAKQTVRKPYVFEIYKVKIKDL